MELYDEGFETEGYQDLAHQRSVMHPKLRIRTSLFSAIEVYLSLREDIHGINILSCIVSRRSSIFEEFQLKIQ